MSDTQQTNIEQIKLIRQMLESALDRLNVPLERHPAPPPVNNVSDDAQTVEKLRNDLAGARNEIGWLSNNMLKVGEILGNTGKLDNLVTHATAVMLELNKLRAR